MRPLVKLGGRVEGSALVEFAVALPLLVVFVVGIYDFSGAYNQRQKIEHAAQAGAIVASAQPTGDMDPTITNPDSTQTVANVVFNALAGDGVLPLANQGSCTPASATVTNSQIAWTYSIAGCSVAPFTDTLTISIDRGTVGTGPPATVNSVVSVSYPYHWRFNSVIQLLFPGSSYSATTLVSETATAQNQI